MKHLTFILAFLSMITAASCQQNNKKKNVGDIKVGGQCEGCEAIYESPVPLDQLNEIDTLPDFNEVGPKLELSGTIYKSDGKTPAPDVILYIYHTDQHGNYTKPELAKGWADRHGYIRGWVKTNSNGFYKFYTLVPASYPNSNNPKHIHPTIKEPGFSEYWIDEFVFADDPLLPDSEKNRKRPVGGNGVLVAKMENGILKATRNITLGMNVEDYPRR